MSGFEAFSETAQQIEREIAIKGVVLGVDWSNEHAVRELAREALTYHADPSALQSLHDQTPLERAKIELFGLTVLMLNTMTESAEEGVHTHGGVIWKRLGKALLEESGAI